MAPTKTPKTLASTMSLSSKQKRKVPEESTISRPIERVKKAKTVSVSSQTKVMLKSKEKEKGRVGKAKPKFVEPEEEEEEEKDEEMDEDQENEGEGEDDEDEEEMIHGFSTDDDDSSDDEDLAVEPTGVDVGKLPTVAKDDATVKRKLEKAKREPAQDRGVIYLGRLPHGFYEDQLKAYFSQFGDVARLRVSRNKKTGRSKHYAFLEFDSSSVAQIVAETMDNYLLMGHILRCKVIPKDQVHPELWVGANRKWRAVPRDRVARVAQNKLRTEEEQAKASKRLIKRQNDKKRKLKEMGISYDFDAVGYKKPVVTAS
ncbi:nucleolar protein [Stygiomarasmius scandens]|uniref:Nucleolar protein n=1 Tax=Marasmiellus scandens TaxID=2682957 RepID=A0ABR1JPN8_9AGAR